MCCFFLQNILYPVIFTYRFETIMNALVLIVSSRGRWHIHCGLIIRKSTYRIREWAPICRKLVAFHMDFIFLVIKSASISVDAYWNTPVRIS